MTSSSEIKEFNEGRYRELEKEKVGAADDIRIRKAVQLVGENGRVLDVGCFDGTISKLILDQGNKVYGLDISEPAVKKAQEKGIKAVCGNVEDPWPFDDNTIDTVFAGEIIEHLFNTDKFLEEVKRVLKPEGFLVLTTPNLASFGRRLLLFLGKNPLIESGCLDVFAGHLRYFVKESLFELLKSHSFRVLKFESTVVNFNSRGSIYSRKLAEVFPTLGSSLIVKCQVQK